MVTLNSSIIAIQPLSLACHLANTNIEIKKKKKLMDPLQARELSV